MDNTSLKGVRFAIAPADGHWVWQAFDLGGRVISQGDAKSRREAAAFVIRETLRSCTAGSSTRDAMSAAA
jgi:hypothetical protein